MAETNWNREVRPALQRAAKEKAHDATQAQRCQQCVWPSRLPGVTNCPFPRCVKLPVEKAETGDIALDREAYIKAHCPPESENAKLVEVMRAVLSGMSHIFANKIGGNIHVSVVGGKNGRRLCALVIKDETSHYRVQDYQLF